MTYLSKMIDIVVPALQSDDMSSDETRFITSMMTETCSLKIITLFKKYLKSKTVVFTVPIRLLYLLGYATGSISKIRRLVESSVVDIEHTKTTLNWSPPQSVEKAFENMVK